MSNGRGPCLIVWKRLNRGLINDSWLTVFPATTITDITSVGSDHSPLLMEMNVRQDTCRKYIKFLDCWVENDTFISLIHKVWSMNVTGNLMWIFHQKLKVVTKPVSLWSRNNMGTSIKDLKSLNKISRKLKKRGLILTIHLTVFSYMSCKLNMLGILKLRKQC